MKIRTVLVDDEPYALEMVKLALRDYESDIDIIGAFLNPQELLDSWEALEPEIVVTDIQMPCVDGFTLIREIQKRATRKIWFVLLSAYSQLDYAREAMRLGVRYYLIKPLLKKDAATVFHPLCEEIRRYHDQEDRITRFSAATLGKHALSLVYPAVSGRVEDAGFYEGAFRYGVAGLFDSAAMGYDEDMARIDYILRHDARYAIVTRNAGEVEFVCRAADAQSVAAAARDFAASVADMKPEHRYFIALNDKACPWFALPAACACATAIAKQAHYRDDCTLMQASLGEPVPLSGEDWQSKLMREWELCHKSEARALTSGMFADWQAARLPFQTMQGLLDGLVFQSLKLLPEGGAELSDAYRKNLHTLDRLHIADITARFMKYGDELCDRIADRRREARSSNDPVLLAVSYIEAHYTEDLTVQSIAKALSFHPAYLGTLFKKQRKCSIHHYLHQVRVHKATQRMKDANASLTDIAMDVGYNSYSAFVVAFEQVMKISPSEYRKR